jgi:hypothetical protein
MRLLTGGTSIACITAGGKRQFGAATARSDARKYRPLNHTRQAMMCKRNGCENATFLSADMLVVTNMPRALVAVIARSKRTPLEVSRAMRNIAAKTQ